MNQMFKNFKFIFCLIFILLIVACNERLQPQTSAEKAIEQKQNEIWIQRVNEISKFTIKWRFFAQTSSDKWSQETVWNFESFNSEFKNWSENIAVESKISIAPKQFTILQEEIKSNYKTAFVNYNEALEKVKNEQKQIQIEYDRNLKEAKEEQQRADEQRRIQAIKEEQERKNEILRNEQQKAIANSLRQELLSFSLDFSKKEQELYEKNYSSIKFPENRDVSLLNDASGRTITWGNFGDNTIEAKLRILNSSRAKYSFSLSKQIPPSQVNEVFLEFSIQEANESNNSCFGTLYKFKKYLFVYIPPSDIKEVTLQVPKFFKNACWNVSITR